MWVDSIFSPILRVKYTTQDTRVGKVTDYDRLNLEIWTDGSIRPEEALTEASKIYRKCLNPLVAYGSLGSEIPAADLESGAGRIDDVAPSADVLSKPIVELALSVRANNCLEAEKIFTVGDLIQRSEEDLLQLRNFGKTSLTEVKVKLTEMGLRLQGDTGEPSEPEMEPADPGSAANI